MNNKHLDELIHSELLPTQQTFKSYEQLAQGDFRFSPKIFKKCALSIQKVIDAARELANGS